MPLIPQLLVIMKNLLVFTLFITIKYDLYSKNLFGKAWRAANTTRITQINNVVDFGRKLSRQTFALC